MDVTIQRHYAKFIYVVPDGLRELMSDITREVLRSQPTDLYTFIADYLDALMITRENARVASSLVVDIVQISETTAELLEKSGMKRSEANRAACVIQQRFKKMMETKRHDKKSAPLDAKAIVDGILEEAHITKERAHSASIIVQKAYRSFMQREQHRRELLSGFIDWRVAARSAIALYRKTGVTYEEAHRAATLIKSAYKGYYQRKVMSRLVEEIKAGESVECLCDMYSIDVPAIEPARPASEECICSIESEDILEAELRDEGCLCEYTSSELIKMGRGEKIITDAGFEPLAPDEEDDEEGYCYCEKNPDHPDRAVRLIEPNESDNATIDRPVDFHFDDEETVEEDENQ
ncbi:hypothetical protein WA026_005831 [Henosepilachna vigintioctopunctata]|uniref:RIIa domain-containing protein n=1 Tax=Henosepilachna vigintioctopunctata TaxID=420089 RepID=A0AAW1TTX2_9CUCU